MRIDEFWQSTLADVIRYVNANAERKTSESRDHWSVMRYQTACLMRMMQDSKSKPLEPTDILLFDDEVEEYEKAKEIKEITQEQSDKLNAAYQRYLNRQ